MAKSDLTLIEKELSLKIFQLNAIYELSSAIHSSFDRDHIFRIFFSILMGPMGISRAFFYYRGNELFRQRGFHFSDEEIVTFKRFIKKVGNKNFYIEVETLPQDWDDLKDLLAAKKIHYLIDISKSKRNLIMVGLGNKFNIKPLKKEDLEFAFFISRFCLIALDNVSYVEQIIEKKRMEHELSIAREIQLSLLPQGVPALKNFEIGVVYEPNFEVGGDYYDILEKRDHRQSIVIADVEGKGLSAALLAASSQAIFRSLNELYFFEPAKFISKANSLIMDCTKGKRFITFCWIVLDDQKKAITYVNAGHVAPFLISSQRVRRLSTGGVLAGFIDSTTYEQEQLFLKKNDVLVALTDGVTEAENQYGEDFGETAAANYVKKNIKYSASEIADRLHKRVKKFCGKQKLRDDFTLIIIKAK